VEAGLSNMSDVGNAGWRSNRASTACIAAFPSEMPLWETLRLRSTTGGMPFQGIRLAHSIIVSTAINYVPFHCTSTIPQHRSSG
jgi:hypothetical protein